MIPLRVYLKNFLCHREQEFVFDGHPVWLLHGPNGVGKSAVFDGMLYALFGEHQRTTSGKNVIGDLLRHGETSLRVEFDFEYDGLQYRVWRTRTRNGSPKQGAIELTKDGPRTILHVDSPADLKAWVTGILGLTYDMFVSAVLLRQGAAEKLIDAGKDARRDLFRGIVDLESYIKLHASIAQARTDVGREVRALEIAVERQLAVSDDELTAAKSALDEAEANWTKVRAEEHAASERLGNARLWEQFDQTRRDLLACLAAASDRTSREGDLRQAVGRLTDLRSVLPALAALTNRKRDHAGATETLEGLIGQYKSLDAQQIATEASAKEARLKAEDCARSLADLDKRISSEEIRRSGLCRTIQQAEKAAELCQRLEDRRNALIGFESNLDHVYSQVSSAVSEAEGAKDALPHLDTLSREREEFHRAVREERVAFDAETAAATQVLHLKGEAVEAMQVVASADDRKILTKQAADIAEHKFTEVTGKLARFNALTGAARCSECGQEIDSDHAAREGANLESALRGAIEERENCRGDFARADADAAEARKLLQQRELECRRLEEIRDTEVRSRQLAADRAGGSRVKFEQSAQELSEEILSHLPPIEESGFPSTADLQRYRRLKADLPGLVRERDRLRLRVDDREKTSAEISTLQQAVAAIGAPEDVTAVREELSQLGEAISGLTATREDTDRTRIAAEKSERELTAQITDQAGKLKLFSTEVGRAESSVAVALERLTEATEMVPVEWREAIEGDIDSHAAALGEEFRELEESGVEGELAALADDRVLRVERERQLTAIDLKIAELSPDHCLPIVEAEAAVTRAETATRAAEKAKGAATNRLETLDAERAKRRSMEKCLAEQERLHTLHQRLTDLLGERGIQLDLMRDAERQIIGSANDILGRLSYGDLRIEPPDPEGERAFDLSIRRVGCCEPISSANLSGGQRFRLAVSLALAICRFANGKSRALESIIIDEGFGSLDRDGRMAMIAELRDPQPLGQLFKRVLIVSHQEDLALAFPVGYSLSSEGGTTVVESFDRR